MSSVPRLWLLAGPPFASNWYRHVVARLGELRADLGVESVTVSPLGGSWSESATALSSRIAPGDVVFAHGLAVPVACAVASEVRLGALVLSNGPLRRVDSATATLQRIAAVPGLGALPFLRVPWLAWLRSSGGLRRAVNNPYAMDRDTVAAVCGELVASPAGSFALRRWLAGLRAPWPDPALLPGRVTLLWGDNDSLHPLAEADEIDAVRGGGSIVVQPGGRFAWPEEMPWALADAVLAAVDAVAPKGPPVTAAPAPEARKAAGTTPKSRKAVRGRGAGAGGANETR